MNALSSPRLAEIYAEVGSLRQRFDMVTQESAETAADLIQGQQQYNYTQIGFTKVGPWYVPRSWEVAAIPNGEVPPRNPSCYGLAVRWVMSYVPQYSRGNFRERQVEAQLVSLADPREGLNIRASTLPSLSVDVVNYADTGRTIRTIDMMHDVRQASSDTKTDRLGKEARRLIDGAAALGLLGVGVNMLVDGKKGLVDVCGVGEIHQQVIQTAGNFMDPIPSWPFYTMISDKDCKPFYASVFEEGLRQFLVPDMDRSRTDFSTP